ncbi:cytochrome P450 [Asimina triloba]
MSERMRHQARWDIHCLVVLDAELKLLGVEGGTEAAAFKPEFYKLMFVAISLPNNLPGTSFRTGLNARKKILSMLGKIMEDRRTSPGDQSNWIDSLLESGESSRFNLTDEQTMDQVITLLHSGFETISPTTMMAVKYLYEHPKVLQELRVIFETLRLTSITNGVMRKATKDVKMNGGFGLLKWVIMADGGFDWAFICNT